jgi:hypothetical protein
MKMARTGRNIKNKFTKKRILKQFQDPFSYHKLQILNNLDLVVFN